MKSILDLPQGLHMAVPEDVYHQRHLGLVSKGALDRLKRSPIHYKAWIDGVANDETGPALDFGKAFHCAGLEPDRFASSYAVEPAWGDCRKTENKTKRDEWRSKNENRVLLAPEDADAIQAMVKAVHSHPLASKMVRDGAPEVTVRWRDEETGLQCKTRADYYVATRRMVVDLKSATDASYEAFRKSVTNYRYHVQDALYRAGFGAIGMPVDHFVFVVVEKTPPHAVAIYTLDSEAIQKGYARCRDGMADMAQCLRDDAWPGYPPTIRSLDLPPWAA